MTIPSPLTPEQAAPPLEAGELFDLYRSYVSAVEKQTGVRSSALITGERFRILWEKLAASERANLERILLDGFGKRARASWPATESVLAQFSAGIRDPEIEDQVQRILGG